MGLLEVIEYHDPSGNEICHKLPEHGSAETRMGSQLVVREYQKAVFFRDGKGLDVLGPGRHTLTTQNIPVLAKLIGLVFDDLKSPFRTEVLFVSQKIFNDMKWGTKEPVSFKDNELGYIQLRAFGNYTMRVTDPLLFVNTLVGGRGRYSADEIADFLRGIIVSRLNDLLGETLSSLFDLPAMYDEIAVAAKVRLRDDFAKYGLELLDLFIQAVTPPEDVQKAIDERASMGAIGDMDRYTRYQTARAVSDAAKNPGQVGDAMGMGLGAGLGMAMPKMMAEQMGKETKEGQKGSDESVDGKKQSSVTERLKQLKDLHGQKLITDAEYEAKRKEILDKV